MKKITLKGSEHAIEVLPECCSFYVSFGVSLLRTLVHSKIHVHLTQSTWQKISSLLEPSRAVAYRYSKQVKFSIAYQYLVLLNDNSEAVAELYILSLLDDPKYLEGLEVLIRCFISCLFPDEEQMLMRCEIYELTHVHLQALCDSLDIHLSLSLLSSFETFFCNKNTALLVSFFKSSPFAYSFVTNAKNYQLYCTYKPEIPSSLKTVLNILSKSSNQKSISLIASIQSAAAEFPEILTTALSKYVKVLPNWTGSPESFTCKKCKQRKTELKYLFCPNNCEICSFCTNPEVCMGCGQTLS